jgi:hypothetical protein
MPQDIRTADEIRCAAMAARTQQGLRLHLRTPDGDTVLYPKDQATRRRWVTAARRQGYTIVTETPEGTP